MLKSKVTSHNNNFGEFIKIGVKSAQGGFTVYSGLDNDVWVYVIPSISVSGYGDTEEEARESLDHNVDTFFEDLMSLDSDHRVRFLKEIGWQQRTFFKKKFDGPFVDSEGVLQNFDDPKSVKIQQLQTA